jgi:selenide,water dikinase
LRPLTNAFHPNDFPALLVGLDRPDDAAVYRINAEQAIISTVDFFPPVVDDPYSYGAIAAANALSDIYAMGGEVLFAINLAAFPANLDLAILTEILRGGADRVRAAGAAIVGGHTIKDNEPKYGLAVTGTIHPDRIITKGGAQSGDVLILTKRLGVGVITTAHKRDKVDPHNLASAIASMTRLNRGAAEAVREVGHVHAMTDITGYSLLGHAHEMAHLSGVDLVFQYSALPWLPGAQHYAAEGIFPGGASDNATFYGSWVSIAAPLNDAERLLMFDPETSGGLLIAVDPAYAEPLRVALIQHEADTWTIGMVTAGNGHIHVEI